MPGSGSKLRLLNIRQGLPCRGTGHLATGISGEVLRRNEG
jgi:hypothetical protein